MGMRMRQSASLPQLVREAAELLREAERRRPRCGAGAKPQVPDWLIGTLIMVAVLMRKKTKASQFRFLTTPAHRRQWGAALGRDDFLARSGWYRRYRRAHRLFEEALAVQAERAVREGVVDPQVVAVDKSLMKAQGPPWHASDRRRGKVPAGVDRQSAWGYSEHHGWVSGYSYEVVVAATKRSMVFPLSASVDTASVAETRSFANKIERLPEQTKAVVLDAAYDANALGERVEFDARGRRTGRRFVCPENPRHAGRKKTKPGYADAARAPSRELRRRRKAFFDSPRGRRLYARRLRTVEPFNQWFKSLFELDDRVWHRGLDNNRTQILAALVSYQLLVRYNHRLGRKNARVRWILDAL